ncbi:hypothetical protein EJ06DRAFT_241138 [Trichodelitschia bisporula]|uniref:Secreted protein n=1 Tax=Trichodelitschia bisporula TaxID=703511 RepID=A0A6G1HKT4_9PEZI|nr:hypothetical protein EJ06DRAFT_241138 [Trichodelitschia bisporula]
MARGKRVSGLLLFFLLHRRSAAKLVPVVGAEGRSVCVFVLRRGRRPKMKLSGDQNVLNSWSVRACLLGQTAAGVGAARRKEQTTRRGGVLNDLPTPNSPISSPISHHLTKHPRQTHSARIRVVSLARCNHSTATFLASSRTRTASPTLAHPSCPTGSCSGAYRTNPSSDLELRSMTSGDGRSCVSTVPYSPSRDRHRRSRTAVPLAGALGAWVPYLATQ